MSFTDPSQADPVQPEAGQGGAGTPDAPYAEYLDRIPEEVRGDVEPVFRDWDSNVTKRFQEASEYRNRWDPYEQAGISQHTPEDVQWALQVRQAALENPQVLREWLDQQHGPVAAPETQQPSPEDPYGFQDPAAQLEQLLKAQLGPITQKLEQYDQRWQAQEQQERARRGEQIVESQFSELKKQHPEAFKDDGPHGARKVVEALALNYVDSDPDHAIPRAFADYQSLRASFEKSLLDGKADTPPAAEGGGVPDVSVNAPKTLGEANAMLIEQLRESNRAG